VESPVEYYSARLSNKQRKKTLIEEVLATETENNRFKNAYAKVQAVKTSGRKAFYKAHKAKRSRRS
jgi:Fcf2 pre-rRNA processing